MHSTSGWICLFQCHLLYVWLFFGILKKCSQISIWDFYLPTDPCSLSQALPGARWEMPSLLPHYDLHWFDHKRQLHYRPVCSLQLFAVTQGTSAAQLFITVQVWHRERYYQWKTVLGCPYACPTFPFIYPSNVQVSDPGLAGRRPWRRRPQSSGSL